MTKQDAQNLLVLLLRVTLKGEEVTEFVRLQQMLNAIINEPEVVNEDAKK